MNDVQVNGKAATMNVAACCGYLDAGTGKYGYDCIEIPNATKTGQIPSPSKVCGHNAGLATDDATTGKTVCSKYHRWFSKPALFCLEFCVNYINAILDNLTFRFKGPLWCEIQERFM